MSVATFPAGAAYNLPLTIYASDGVTPSTAYLNTDTLSAYLWPGDDQATPDSPTTAWSVSGENTGVGPPYLTVHFAAADTLGYTPGVYRLAVNATRGGATSEIFRDSIELTFPAPSIVTPATVTATVSGGKVTGFTGLPSGSGYPINSTTIPVTINGGLNGGYSATAVATSNGSGVITAITLLTAGTNYYTVPTVKVGIQPPPVYCSLQDMQDLCSWIQQYEDQDRDETGFLKQRAKARVWLDNIIVASWPGARVTYIQDGWPSNYGQFTLIANPWLQAGLAQGYLMLSTERGQAAIEACAAYSIALVLRAQMGPTSGIEKYAGYWMRRAQAAVCNLTCELDINGDGLADIAIPLGLTNTRRG